MPADFYRNASIRAELRLSLDAIRQLAPDRVQIIGDGPGPDRLKMIEYAGLPADVTIRLSSRVPNPVEAAEHLRAIFNPLVGYGLVLVSAWEVDNARLTAVLVENAADTVKVSFSFGPGPAHSRFESVYVITAPWSYDSDGFLQAGDPQFTGGLVVPNPAALTPSKKAPLVVTERTLGVGTFQVSEIETDAKGPRSVLQLPPGSVGEGTDQGGSAGVVVDRSPTKAYVSGQLKGVLLDPFRLVDSELLIGGKTWRILEAKRTGEKVYTCLLSTDVAVAPVAVSPVAV